ncbi:MAG: hypothetical protein HYZ48_02090 [Chlamydiales bacterium]|nr:hypothetical protein [Chlamydiales bacterium]
MHNSLSHSDQLASACAAEPVAIKDGQPAFVVRSANQLLSCDERAEFYTGHERMTLQTRQVQRVRDLQEVNDNLQRQVVKNEKELMHSQDPLTILAEIEHCNIMIARNTGEILNIYALNEARLKRIAELESENINLQQEMSDTQAKFITCHEMNQRTKFAAEFFLTKAKYEKNIAEIRELSSY